MDLNGDWHFTSSIHIKAEPGQSNFSLWTFANEKDPSCFRKR